MALRTAPDDLSRVDEARPDLPPPRRRRLILSLAGALVLAGIATWWFVLRDEAATGSSVAMTPQLVEVTSGTVGESVTAEGTVAAASSEDLSFSSAGTVTSVAVAAGDRVVAGQVLATIDSAELAEAVARAEADLADAEAQLADDGDAGADDEQLEVDAAAVTTAEDALADAQEALEGATLVAGFDGMVTTVDLTVGEELGEGGSSGTTLTGTGSGSGQSAGGIGGTDTPAAGSAVADTGTTSAQVQIVSAGTYEVELEVDTADIASVEVGQSVELTISTDTAGTSTEASGFPGGFGPPGALPGAATGEATAEDDDSTGDDSTADDSSDDVVAEGVVADVGRVADASSGVASYSVLVTFSADAEQVWVGAAATAEIAVAERTGVTQISSRAVSTVAGDSVVTVAIDGTVDGETEQRSVETGETVGDMVEIVSGLEPGELVVVQAPDFGAAGGGGPGGEAPQGFEPPSGMELPAAAQDGGA